MDNRGTAPFSSIEASYRKAPPALQGATGPEGQTATKRGEQSEFHSQVTPRPQRKILLFGEDKSRHLFPLVRDREIGIEGRYQNVVIESVSTAISRATMTTAGPRARSCSGA